MAEWHDVEFAFGSWFNVCMLDALQIPTWLSTLVTLLGWIAAVYFYFKYRAFRKIECDKEIDLLELELKTLEEKLERTEGFWKAKMASQGALDSTAGQEIIRIKVEEAEREVEAVKIKIKFYEKIKKHFIDLR